MQEQSSNTMHYVIALLLGVVGLLIILIFVSIRSQAETVNTSATVTNADPSVDNITVATSSNGASLDGATFTPSENATKTLYVYGTYTDNNGCDEVSDGSGALTVVVSNNFYATTTCMTNTNVDPLKCYYAAENTSSTLAGPGANCVITGCSGGTDVQASYACTLPIHHFADATDASTYSANKWRTMVSVGDTSSGSSTLAGLEFEMATLNAIDSGATIAYGALALGATSASDQTLTITNTGNKDGSDVLLSGSVLSCTDGFTVLASQKYATSSGVAYGSKVGLTGSGVSAVMNIKKQINSSTAATSNTYWMLQLPSSGVSGSCTGTVTVTAN